MKKFLLIAILLFSIPSFAATSGKIQRSNSEQIGIPPTAAVGYGRDCFGNGKPADMKTTMSQAASGVGSFKTITQTEGSNIYILTDDTSVANIRVITPVSVNGVACVYP